MGLKAGSSLLPAAPGRHDRGSPAHPAGRPRWQDRRAGAFML